MTTFTTCTLSNYFKIKKNHLILNEGLHESLISLIFKALIIFLFFIYFVTYSLSSLFLPICLFSLCLNIYSALGLLCYSHTSASCSYHFLHKKVPVPSQECYNCCPLIWCVGAFNFTFWLGTFRLGFFKFF